MDTTFLTLADVHSGSSSESGSIHAVSFDDRSAIWSVNGGYLVASMLRAVEKTSKFDTPSSISVQFVGPVVPGEAVIETTSVYKSSRNAELLECRLTQGERLAALCQIWTLDARDGPYLCEARMPPVPHPDELRPVDEIHKGREPRHRFWDIFDERQINGVDIGTRRNSLPRSLRWMRYKGDLANGSPYVRAGLTIPIIDMLGVPAASNANGKSILTSLAPTIQLSAHFYELGELDGWLLGDAHAESVCDGRINTRVKIWSAGGALVAQGLTQMLLKPGEGAYVAKQD